VFWHDADWDGDGIIDINNLLRMIQFYNQAGGFGCAPAEGESQTEDGFVPGGDLTDCLPHTGDYAPQDWRIQLNELLRMIQIFNWQGYLPCPEGETEDGYCIGQ
jgi:hypothetical protein